MDKPNIADQLDEPADGTHLVIEDGCGDRTLIWRDDFAAEDRARADEYWFFGTAEEDPLTWHHILTHAVAVYPVADKPLAKLPA